jgi:hypothetical protein
MKQTSLLLLRRTVVLFVFAMALSIMIAGQETDRTYTNARFDYSIAYPANLLYPQGESANGDGQKFLSKDGHDELIVWGSNNALNERLKDVYERESVSSSDHPKRVVSYKVLKPNWFVVSGREVDRIFYQKTILTGDVFKSFRIEYSVSDKARFDQIIKRIEKSFRF